MITSESSMLEVETSSSIEAESGVEEQEPYAILWVAGGEVYLYDDAPE